MANWFEKILPSFIRKETTKKSTIPEGLWQSCSSCNNILYVPELESNLFVCPKCDHHIRIGARKRLELFLDAAEIIEISEDKAPRDWLKFKDTKSYKDRIDSAEKTSNEREALIAMKGYLKKCLLSLQLSNLDIWGDPWAQWLARNLWIQLILLWRISYRWFVSLQVVGQGCKSLLYPYIKWLKQVQQ